ncbi:MAG: ABC-type transporter, integral rane subunit [Deferribacteraceae bacterium]|nr:ABC-type transporter, integral rane subunit [Deferribacteraceae bacterium]
MKSAEKNLHYLINFDTLSKQGCVLGKINPASKIFVFLTFLIALVSINKYDILKTLLLSSFTFAMINMSRLKYSTFIKICVVLSPFILLFVVFNPILDKNIFAFYNYSINAGYISALTTLIKFINTTAISLLIITSTTVHEIAYGLYKLKIPGFMAIQIILMYRFIFLFLSDIINTTESIKSRGGYRGNIKWKDMKQIVSSFFARAIYRGEDVYYSMLSRGFNLQNLNADTRFKLKDFLFLFLSICYILLLRLF